MALRSLTRIGARSPNATSAFSVISPCAFGRLIWAETIFHGLGGEHVLDLERVAVDVDGVCGRDGGLQKRERGNTDGQVDCHAHRSSWVGVRGC
jgi:hypothetical protein